MDPFQIGTWAGAGVVGAISGAARGVAEAIDFAGLLTANDPADTSTNSAGTEPFEGLNDRHKAIAEQRSLLADALQSLESLLASIGAADRVEIRQEENGDWMVSGAGEQRVPLERALASSPDWNESWGELLGAADALRELRADPATVPGLSDRRPFDSAGLPIEARDVRLERRSGSLTATVG